MIKPSSTSTAPRVVQGDADLSRLAPLSPTSGANPRTAAARRPASGDVRTGASEPRRVAQNIAGGGSAIGNGNMRFDSVPGGRIGTTAAHVLIHRGLPAAVPTRINVDGSEVLTSIREFFPSPEAVRIYTVVGSGGKGIDVVKLGRDADIKAHFETLATAQPTVDDMKRALAKPQAKWQIETASAPQPYAPGATGREPLTDQTNSSETTPKFSIRLTALPLQIKDLAADLKASGMGSFVTRTDSWLALGAIGGDENNRSSPYKNLYLVNSGISGSESKASGISVKDNGTLIASVDSRDSPLWTLDTVKTLVEKSASLRSALATKFPDLTTSQAAEKLYLQGIVKIAFITKDIAVGNLGIINRTPR